MPEEDVELLKLVSEPLRMKLHYEIHQPMLANHPLLLMYSQVNTNAMQRLCHVALSKTSFSRGDVLFNFGEMPSNPSVLFIISGKLRYWRHSKDVDQIQMDQEASWQARPALEPLVTDCTSSAAASEPQSTGGENLAPTAFANSMKLSTTMFPGHWASEGVLWTNWLYCGELRADTETVLLLLNAAKFIEVSLAQQHGNFNPSSYGSTFVRALNEGRIHCSDACTDIDTDYLMFKTFGRQHGRTVVDYGSESEARRTIQSVFSAMAMH